MSNRAMHQPMSVQSHCYVGLQVMLELHRRIHGNNFGALPKSLRDDAWNMSEYCLDAPDLLPAGSTKFYQFGPEPDEWIPEPTTVDRDGSEAS